MSPPARLNMGGWSRCSVPGHEPTRGEPVAARTERRRRELEIAFSINISPESKPSHALLRVPICAKTIEQSQSIRVLRMRVIAAVLRSGFVRKDLVVGHVIEVHTVT